MPEYLLNSLYNVRTKITIHTDPELNNHDENALITCVNESFSWKNFHVCRYTQNGWIRSALFDAVKEVDGIDRQCQWNQGVTI